MSKLAAILVVLLTVFSSAPPALATPPLSSSERQRLERGDVVVLDVLPGGGGSAAQGGTAVALVQADPAAVWRVLIDYPGHRGIYPRVVDATVLEHDGNHALVRYVVGVGRLSFGFHIDNYADAEHGRLVWRLAHDRPNGLFRDSWGYWQVEPTSTGVMLTYAMAARTVLPAFLTRGAERAGLEATVRAVRDHAERHS
jgi:ribosome-associated toxin RatA of RatAB toxin-antitoxin module